MDLLSLDTEVLQTDNEPAIVGEAVKAARLPKEIRLRGAPAASSQCNGCVGQTIRHVGGQVRTLRIAIEAKYATKLHAGLAIWPWICHAA